MSLIIYEMNRSLFNSIISGLLIILWVYAGLSKLMDFERSQHEMQNQIFSIDVANILVWGVPLAEFITVALLLIPRTNLSGLYVSALLLSSFTGYIILVLSNTFSRIPCNCGGILESMSWGQHLVFNTIFLTLTLSAILMYKKKGGDWKKRN